MIDYKDFECAVCGDDEDTDLYSDLDADIFFVAEPSINVMLNIAPMFRIGLGVSCRYVHDVEIKGVEDADLSGFSGILTAKIGRFQPLDH